jgi:hypothetical protein
LIIDLSLENHSIDELVDVLNRNLLFGFTAGYSENSTTLHCNTANLSAAIVTEPHTTSAGINEVRAGDSRIPGSYYAPGGVKFEGTMSFYISSNQRTRIRDLI